MKEEDLKLCYQELCIIFKLEVVISTLQNDWDFSFASNYFWREKKKIADIRWDTEKLSHYFNSSNPKRQ